MFDLRSQQESLIAPITALAFYHTPPDDRLLLLVAQDVYLHVYDVRTSHSCGRSRVFDAQPVHGLAVTGGKVLVWGGRSVAVVGWSFVKAVLLGDGDGDSGGNGQPDGVTRYDVSDYIYDGMLLPPAGDEGRDAERGVLVTAHNELLPFCIQKGGKDASLSGTPSVGPLLAPNGSSRPMLYSARLAMSTAKDGKQRILVVGGTASGEIVVWTCEDPTVSDVSQDTSRAQCELLFVFRGHEGSVFGVAVSEEMEVETGGEDARNGEIRRRRRLLASCSDDRTVRLWDVTEDGKDKRATDMKGKSVGETSANSEASHLADGDGAARRCVAVAVGHVSRIWHVRFAPVTGRGGPVTLYSFGEDTTRQTWELTSQSRAENALGGELRPSGTAVSCHSGKNIWAVSECHVDYDDGTARLLTATGGADGKVALLEDAVLGAGRSGCRFELGVTFAELLRGLARAGNGAPLSPPPTSSPSPSLSPSPSSSAPVPDPPGKKMAASPAAEETFSRYVFIAETRLLVKTSHGRLLVCDTTGHFSWEEVALSEAVRSGLGPYAQMCNVQNGAAVLGASSGRMYLFRDGHGVEKITALPGKIVGLVSLPGPPNRATVLATVLNQSRAHLISINCTTTSLSSPPSAVNFKRDVIATAATLCGPYLVLGSRIGDVVALVQSATTNSFVTLASRRDCTTRDAITSIVALPGSSSSFLTTCRDGMYRVYDIVDDGLCLRHEASTPAGVLEQARFVCGHLLLLGFRGKHFVAWDETARDEKARVECGGGHRAFDFVVGDGNADKIAFVHTRHSTMHLYMQRRAAVRQLKPGTHGREMRCVAACGRYVATAAEDTAVRIWESQRCVAVLERHRAGPQCLRWLGAEYLLSSAGNEELYIWRVSHMRHFGLAVVCESDYPGRTADRDLRIVDFDVLRSDDTQDAMLITLAFSNSTLRSYLYRRDAGWERLATGRYTGACLTQIRMLRHRAGSQGHELDVLTASTDGHLGLWHCCASPEYRLVTAAQLHQNCIKALHLVAPTRWLVVTGGDDNALGFLGLDWTPTAPDRPLAVRYRARVKDAHAAGITAVALLNGEGRGKIRLVTASNDQRVKVWRVRVQEGKDVRVALLEDEYSAVADAAGLEILDDGRVMVVGVGMEVWTVR